MMKDYDRKNDAVKRASLVLIVPPPPKPQSRSPAFYIHTSLLVSVLRRTIKDVE